MKCEACQVGSPQVTDEQLTGLKKTVPEWSIIEINTISQLQRVYKFKNFKLAMEFANQLANLSEEEFHHPGMLIEWGKVTVTWWSHSIKGLHLNDFIMAVKTDNLIN